MSDKAYYRAVVFFTLTYLLHFLRNITGDSVLVDYACGTLGRPMEGKFSAIFNAECSVSVWAVDWSRSS